MRVIKTTTISILALGLLAGSAVGVAAQDDAANTMAPSVFTTSPVPGPPEFSEDAATGLPVAVVEFTATDPRAAGMMTAIEDVSDIEADGRAYSVLSASVRLVNDGGTWVGTNRGINVESDDGAGGWAAEYTGEGGYEGLKMYTFRTFADLQDEGTWVGFIVPADVVPAIPELPAE